MKCIASNENSTSDCHRRHIQCNIYKLALNYSNSFYVLPAHYTEER